jgi:uncharacterized protein (DUF433 family)
MTSASSLKTPLMDWSGCAWVESVEGRLSGVPVVMGTRMQADGVLENFDDGLSGKRSAITFFWMNTPFAECWLLLAACKRQTRPDARIAR